MTTIFASAILTTSTSSSLLSLSTHTHTFTYITRVKKINGERIASTGRPKNERMMNRVYSVSNKIVALQNSMPNFDEELKAMNDRLADGFREKHVTEVVQDLKKASKKKHVPTAMEKQKGVTVSPRVKGLVQFGKLNHKKVDGKANNNLEVLKIEAKGRLEEIYMTEDEREEKLSTLSNLTKLKKFIKEHEAERAGVEFDPLYFMPQYTQKADYTEAQQRGF